MTAVARLLRTLRLASRLSVDEAAVIAAMAPERVRELEKGRDLTYLEGLRVAKAYLLCPSCFKRHFEGAVDRDMALATSIQPGPDSAAAGGAGSGEPDDASQDDAASIEGSKETIDTPYARAILTASR